MLVTNFPENLLLTTVNIPLFGLGAFKPKKIGSRKKYLRPLTFAGSMGCSLVSLMMVLMGSAVVWWLIVAAMPIIRFIAHW